MRKDRRINSCRTLTVALFLLAVCACRDDATVMVWVGGAPSADGGPADSPSSEAAKDQSRPSEDANENEKANTSDSGNDKPGESKAPAGSAGDAAEEGSSAEEPPAENPLGGCGICHIDVEDEVVPTLHFKEKVACVKCHGRSVAHAADENNEVPPDQVFTRKNVDRFCETCHECDRPKPAERPKVRPVCIDCHGAHDLALISAEKKDGAPQE